MDENVNRDARSMMATPATVFGQAAAVEGLITIHTEEATLEDIFIEFAGKDLE